MIPPALCVSCLEDKGAAPACPHCGFSAAQPPRNPTYLAPGTILREQYLVARVLGHGGFGVTYLGWDLHLARKIAIKEYYPSGVGMRAGAPEVFPCTPSRAEEYQFGLERFLDEARVVARFENHPNIIWVQNFFTANGTAYIILEYLDGMTFEEYLRAVGGKLDWPTALRVLTPVMDALREVHRVKLLHRDVAPDNIYLLRNGLVKLIDFGAARYSLSAHSQNLSVVLKPGYAPPEQYQSRGNQGPWTDVYACAGTLYRAVTGKIPPTAPDRQAGEAIPAPDLPPEQAWALAKALALRPEDRWTTVEEFQQALQAPSPPSVVPAPPAPAPTPGPGPVPRPDPIYAKWIWPAVGVMALLVVLLVAAVFLIPSGPPPEIRYLKLTPPVVATGEAATLSWSVTEGTTVEIDGLGAQQPTGTMQVKPTATTVYVLRAKRNGAATSQRAELVVVERPPPPAMVLRFEFDPPKIKPNETATLHWEVADAAQVVIGSTEVPAKGSREIQVTESTGFVLRAKGLDGALKEHTATLFVDTETGRQPQPQPQPVGRVQIVRFEIRPSAVAPGEAARVYWDVRNASSVTLNGKSFPNSGDATVPAVPDFTVVLRAEGVGGPLVERASLVVRSAAAPDPGPAPRILRFEAAPNTEGRPGMWLNWAVEGAQSITISPDPGVVQQARGSVLVTPSQTTQYRLVARAADGTAANQFVTVRVNAAPRTPEFSWMLQHVHGPVGSPLFCVGQLVLEGESLLWQPRESNDGFTAPLSAIDSVRTHRFGLPGHRGFSVKLRTGKTYNFTGGDAADEIVAAIQARMSTRTPRKW
jgi:serine/threonine protein kinase